MKRLIILIIITAVCKVEVVNAQTENSMNGSDILFHAIRSNYDKSYITFGKGIGNIEPLVFEALINPYYLLRIHKNAKWAVSISPAITIRMYTEESFPVRTPSYQPQITYYHQLNNKYISNAQLYSYFYFKVAHHSNGQDGNFFNEDGSINTLNGSFATNYLVIGIFVNRNGLSKSNIGEYLQTSVEIHPNIGRSEELNGLYSFVRWNNSFRLFRFPQSWGLNHEKEHPQFQLTLKTSWLFGEMGDTEAFDITERFNFIVNFSYRPQIWRDVSLFVNYYSGKDYYNIYFYRNISLLSFGIQAQNIL